MQKTPVQRRLISIQANGAHQVIAGINLLVISTALITVHQLTSALLIFGLAIISALFSRLAFQSWYAVMISGGTLLCSLLLFYLLFGSSNPASAIVKWPWGSSFGVDLLPLVAVVWLRIVGMLVIGLSTIQMFGKAGFSWALDRKRIPRLPLIPLEILASYFGRLTKDYASVKEAYFASGRAASGALSWNSYGAIAATFILSTLVRVREIAVAFVSRSLDRNRTAAIYLVRSDWMSFSFLATVCLLVILIRLYL